MRTLIAVLLALTPNFLGAQEAKEIVKQYKNAMDAADQEATLSMKLISKKGAIRERTLTWSSRTDKDGLEASYLHFLAPADIKGSAFLTIENRSGQDDQWLYLPALKRSRRISSDEKGKSFMGTDFTYEDIGSEEVNENRYRLLRTEGMGNDIVFVIEATYANAQKSRETGYSRRVLHISKANSMLVKAEFYGPDGNLIKTLECSGFEYFPELDKWRPKTMTMSNLEKGSQTILVFTNYKINKGIDPERFTVRNLESN
jgi:hypothetical protein